MSNVIIIFTAISNCTYIWKIKLYSNKISNKNISITKYPRIATSNTLLSFKVTATVAHWNQLDRLDLHSKYLLELKVVKYLIYELPASASNKLIITAIAASSFPSDDVVGIGASGIAELPIIRIISESESKFI